MINPEDMEPRDQIAAELFGNAAKIKGDDFANYASCLCELGQLLMMLRRSLRGDMSELEQDQMVAMAMVMVSSIDSKIFTNMSMDDRAEAGNLAKRVIEETRKLKGAT